MKTIKVKLDNRSYPIWVERGILTRLPKLINLSKFGKCVIITQSSIQNLFGKKLEQSLKSRRINFSTVIIPAGEEAKSLSQVESIYRELIKLQCDRTALLLALGGGVVGDVAGFVAATYMRGIAYIQIPTSLLAMVDSAIGGKTGVNLTEGKNLVGAFYQPMAVVVDPELVRKLPKREVVSAMAEIFKYGAIRDRKFFELLQKKIDALLTLRDTKLLTSAIARCCKIKADVVSKDEKEKNLRRILNFGHTIGHALETTVGYGQLTHGEAISYGMLCAGEISRRLGFLNQKDLELLASAIQKLPLPRLKNWDRAKLLSTIKHDKKVKAGKLHFVVLKGLGNAVVTDKVTEKDILSALKKL